MNETASQEIKNMISNIIEEPPTSLLKSTDIRVLKIMEKLNKRIDEVEQDVQQIIDPLRHETPKYFSLGYINAWTSSAPEAMLQICKNKGHQNKTEKLNESGTHKRVYCDEGCAFEYFVDSSD